MNILLTEATSVLPPPSETPPAFNTAPVASQPGPSASLGRGPQGSLSGAPFRWASGARAPCSPHRPVMEAQPLLPYLPDTVTVFTAHFWVFFFLSFLFFWGLLYDQRFCFFAAADLEPARLCIYESFQEGLRGCSPDQSRGWEVGAEGAGKAVGRFPPPLPGVLGSF